MEETFLTENSVHRGIFKSQQFRRLTDEFLKRIEKWSLVIYCKATTTAKVSGQRSRKDAARIHLPMTNSQ